MNHLRKMMGSEERKEKYRHLRMVLGIKENGMMTLIKGMEEVIRFGLTVHSMRDTGRMIRLMAEED
jgi:hypothetical protein